jgi:hypothetical protein
VAAPAGRPVALGAPSPASNPEAGPSQAGEQSGSGPDLGLVLACLGLLAAAALLGLSQDGQRATRRTGHRIARVLQPMHGRR